MHPVELGRPVPDLATDWLDLVSPSTAPPPPTQTPGHSHQNRSPYTVSKNAEATIGRTWSTLRAVLNRAVDQELLLRSVRPTCQLRRASYRINRRDPAGQPEAVDRESAATVAIEAAMRV
jgi:hypothetical protein